MKRMTYFVMALALVLGFTQCKKENLEPENEGKQVMITLNVGGGDNNGSKAVVTPPSVTFETGDEILVASDGHYVGTLTYNGTNFSGDITNPVVGEPLYFYFLGNNAVLGEANGNGDITSCTVNVSDQTNYPHLPVISMGVSIDRSNHNAIVEYSSEVTSYEAQLHNKASLIKFKVTTPSDSPICITGMNNQVTVNFNHLAENDGFSYDKADANGVIKMKGGNGTNVEKWAVVLKQDPLTAGAEGTAYTLDGNYKGTRPAIPAITMNQYLNEDRTMGVSTLNPEGSLSTPLTFEAITAGATVTFTKGSSFTGTVQYSTDGSTWSDYTSGSAIPLANVGDKVMFHGDNIAYYGGSVDPKASKFSCSADCYIYGNIMSLISSTDYATTTSVGSNAFREMFKGNSHIKSHDTKDLILPATSIGDNCYAYMFQFCTGLTTPPVILAATLNGSNCCAGMLEGTSLTSVPELHVTNLVKTCFKNMFKGCSNLTSVPSDYLPCTTLNEYCYEGMFQNCSELTSVPNLPATSLAKGCYKNMFNGCTKLNSITCLATSGINADNSTSDWVSGVASSGTFTKANDATWPTGNNGIPSGWTPVDTE